MMSGVCGGGGARYRRVARIGGGIIAAYRAAWRGDVALAAAQRKTIAAWQAKYRRANCSSFGASNAAAT